MNPGSTISVLLIKFVLGNSFFIFSARSLELNWVFGAKIRAILEE